MKMELVGGPRDGEVIDLDDPRWGFAGAVDPAAEAGVLPPRITLEPHPTRATSYRLVSVDGDEGRYQFDPELTAKVRAGLGEDRARRRHGGRL